ncbi:MAG TPA: FAD-binding protein, partial [Pseudogracilibacillus sp.]|nr:FAD-binding protein [Pseudogracilibacillus sp.]
MINDHIKNMLQDIVGIENVVTDNASLLAYSYDATARYQSLPDAMVAPRNTEEVASIVQLCNTEQIPIVPRGSGTNLCAGTTPSEGG